MNVTELDRLDQVLEYANNAEVLSVDTEGYFEVNNKLLAESETVGISIAGPNFEEYFPFRHLSGDNLPGEMLNSLKKVIESKSRVVFHNAKHDIIALKRLGIETGPFYDTMLMAHMIDENIKNKSLDYLSKMYGGEPKNRPKEMQDIIDTFGWAYIPVQYMNAYAANDAKITWELFYKLHPEFKEQNLDGELWDVEQKFTRVLGNMELQGVKVDKELCTKEQIRGLSIMKEIERELGFKPSSPKELSKFLLEDMRFPVVKRTKTNNPSFDKKAMEIYDEMLMLNNDTRAKMVATFRGWQKTCSSNYKPYLDMVSSDGRLRCNYKMHGTVTGRLSCENPNLQQIPRSSEHDWNGKLKQAFIAEDGFKLWESDYSQLEFRLSAAYAKEKALIEIFADENRDVFDEIASSLHMRRQDVKTLTYTIAYGGGVNRIKNVFGVSTQAARAIREGYYKSYPNLRKVSDIAARKCRQNGYLTLWSGRRRHFADPEMDAHKAFNSVVQGGAAEIVKRSIIRLDDEGLNNKECRLLLQVHDSVVAEIEEGKEETYLPEIKRVMEDVKPRFGVKFKVDVHEWGH